MVGRGNEQAAAVRAASTSLPGRRGLRRSRGDGDRRGLRRPRRRPVDAGRAARGASGRGARDRPGDRLRPGRHADREARPARSRQRPARRRRRASRDRRPTRTEPARDGPDADASRSRSRRPPRIRSPPAPAPARPAAEPRAGAAHPARSGGPPGPPPARHGHRRLAVARPAAAPAEDDHLARPADRPARPVRPRPARASSSTSCPATSSGPTRGCSSPRSSSSTSGSRCVACAGRC